MKDTLSISEPIYSDGGDTIYLQDQIEDKSNNMKFIDEKVALKEAIRKFYIKCKIKIINSLY